jgi:hypothetical protein
MDKQDSDFLFGKNGCPYARQKKQTKNLLASLPSYLLTQKKAVESS